MKPPPDPAGLRRRVPLRLPAEEPKPADSPRLRIGLLGGSFNPAHEGHLYISVEAIKRLRLDQLWWLVSPQNPLKPSGETAPLAERLNHAREVARHPRIRVLALESRLGTRYTIDTLRRLGRWRDYRFVWVMGADNLAQLPLWRRWEAIMHACPVAVMERHPYSYAVMAGKAAERFRSGFVEGRRSAALAELPPPAWTFLRLRPHPASSTAIRRQRARPGVSTSNPEYRT
jgi:nicotinate-nucleotide adenylyltransferase